MTFILDHDSWKCENSNFFNNYDYNQTCEVGKLKIFESTLAHLMNLWPLNEFLNEILFFYKLFDKVIAEPLPQCQASFCRYASDQMS